MEETEVLNVESEMPFLEGNILNNLADEYNLNKRNAVKNVIVCGKILFDAKRQVEHGNYLRWLKDSRVCESERTASRLISIYKNYMHFLDLPDSKLSKLTTLGVTQLLEFTHLPDDFKKEIHIVNDNNIEEIKTVVDEEKLINFMEKGTVYKGEIVPIKDLPKDALKKEILNEGGKYETKGTEDIEAEESEDNVVKKAVDTLKEKYHIILAYSVTSIDIQKQLDNFDEVTVFELNEDEKQKWRDCFKELKSHLEAVMVQLNDKEGYLSN